MRVLNVEVGYENDFHERVYVRVGVDGVADGGNHLDDPLGHEVSGCGFAAEDERPRRDYQAGILLEPVVEGNDVQHVEVLAFVLVDPLDLNVEHPGRIQLDVGRRVQVFREPCLVGALDVSPSLAELGVIDERLQPAQPVQLHQPAVADRLVESVRSPGLASATNRRGVTPLVTLPNRCGHIS